MKRAVAEASAFIVTEQLPWPEQAPSQPAKTVPCAGSAVSVTALASTKVALQVAGQSIPAGAEVTRPAPVTATESACLELPALGDPLDPPQATPRAHMTAMNDPVFPIMDSP